MYKVNIVAGPDINLERMWHYCFCRLPIISYNFIQTKIYPDSKFNIQDGIVNNQFRNWILLLVGAVNEEHAESSISEVVDNDVYCNADLKFCVLRKE